MKIHKKFLEKLFLSPTNYYLYKNNLNKIMRYKSGVYAIINLKTDKMYIGSSKNIASRIQQHKSQLEKGLHYNLDLQKDYIELGREYFRLRLVEECDNRFERERFHIENNNNLYNIHLPDNNGKIKHQPDSVKEKIKKICAQDIINNPEKYAEARKKSTITIKKMIADGDSRIGIAKKVKVVLYNEKENLQFDSIKEAAVFINVTAPRITECLVGFKHKEKGVKRKVNSIKGYKCKYLEN